MMSKRLLFIDYTKGLGIILLLFAHTMIIDDHYIGIWISSFFMPLFFVTCGILLFLKFGEKKPSFSDWIILFFKRLFQLGIPYVAFCVILSLFYISLSLFSKTDINILNFLWRIISLKGIDSMWFIPVFFFAELFFAILLVLPRLSLCMQVIVFAVGVFFICFNTTSNNYFLFFIIRVFVCSVFISIGFWLAKLKILEKANIVISCLLIVVGIPLAIYNGPIGLAVLRLNNGWIFLLTASINCIGIMLFFALLEKKGIQLHFLEMFGKNSIVVLCTNNLFIETIRLLDSKITNNFLSNAGVLGSIIFTCILLVLEFAMIKISRIKKVSTLFGKK